MSLIAAVMDLTRPELPLALDSLHERAVRMTLADFFRRSETLSHQATVTVDGTSPVSVRVPYDSTLVRLKRAVLDGKQLVTGPDSSGERQLWLDRGKLHITADLIGTLTLDLRIAPSPVYGDADLCDAEDWMETLMHGALGRMYAQMNYAWYDTTMSAYHRSEYELGLDAARVQQARAEPRPVQGVRYGGY
jgi:hypothetical protein